MPVPPLDEDSAGWCLLIPICTLRHSVQDRGLQPPWEWQCDTVRERVTLSVAVRHLQGASVAPPPGCLGAFGTCVNTEKGLEHPALCSEGTLGDEEHSHGTQHPWGCHPALPRLSPALPAPFPLAVESNSNLLQLIAVLGLLLLPPEKFPDYFHSHQESSSCLCIISFPLHSHQCHHCPGQAQE